MENVNILIAAIVLSAVKDYQALNKRAEKAMRSEDKYTADTCRFLMAQEKQWLTQSGFPEAIGLDGDVIVEHINEVIPPEDLVAALGEALGEENDNAEPDEESEDFDHEEEDEFGAYDVYDEWNNWFESEGDYETDF